MSDFKGIIIFENQLKNFTKNKTFLSIKTRPLSITLPEKNTLLIIS